MTIDKSLHAVKKALIIVLTGICMGLISAVFLTVLETVTSLRETHQWLIWTLPLVCICTAFVYNKFGKGSDRGNNLIIESMQHEINIPGRMGVFTFLFTGLSHLAGASVGREGTAVQMGGVLGNKLAGLGKLTGSEKQTIVFAGVSAGFGSVFGTPFAGAFFGMEVCEVGKLHHESAFACLVASFTADTVTKLCGAEHTRYVLEMQDPFGVRLLLAVLAVSVLFGLVARFFSILVHVIKLFYKKRIKNAYIRALVSSFVLLGVILIFRTVQYNGLSTWMIEAGFHGQTHWYEPISKFILTVLSLGAGFQGGEATPLFDIGASIGGTAAQLMQVSPSLLAALGYVCVFGNAANIPVTSIAMGLELFGINAVPYFIIAVIIGYYVTGHYSIYGAQKISRPKFSWHSEHEGKTMEGLR